MLNWLDDATGGSAQLRWTYRRSDAGDSTLLLGAQVDAMRLIDSALPQQVGGEWVRFGDSTATPLIQPGRETIYSGFATAPSQVQRPVDRQRRAAPRRQGPPSRRQRHRPQPAGRDRMGAEQPVRPQALLRAIVRRFPLLVPLQRLSCVPGSSDLKPEHLQSLQLTPGLNLMDGKLRNTFNFFYNDVSDFVFRNNAAKPVSRAMPTPVSSRALGSTTRPPGSGRTCGSTERSPSST